MAPIDNAINSSNAQLDNDPKGQQSICNLARMHGVHNTTLLRRLSGQSLSQSQVHTHGQTLNTDEEIALVEYIPCMAATGKQLPFTSINALVLELI